jgi:hypothetical protein
MILEIGLVAVGVVWVGVAANGLKTLKYRRAYDEATHLSPPP